LHRMSSLWIRASWLIKSSGWLNLPPPNCISLYQPGPLHTSLKLAIQQLSARSFSPMTILRPEGDIMNLRQTQSNSWWTG
jgi:hypothetical protein